MISRQSYEQENKRREGDDSERERGIFKKMPEVCAGAMSV